MKALCSREIFRAALEVVLVLEVGRDARCYTVHSL